MSHPVHKHAVCPVGIPATGEPCGHVHGYIPQADRTAICWCATHRVRWLCGELLKTNSRMHVDESKDRLWDRIDRYQYMWVEGCECSEAEMVQAIEVDLRQHGRCPDCGHIDGFFVCEAQLWLWCNLCKKRWRWQTEANPRALFSNEPPEYWFHDTVMQYEDVTAKGFGRLAAKAHLPPPVRIPRTAAEESLARHVAEQHSRPLCPELEHPGSEPMIGVCPECGLASGCLKIGAQTWYYCDEHQTRWHAENSHTAPQNQPHDGEAWRANAEKLAAYQIVKPAACKDCHGHDSLVMLVHAVLEGQERDRRKTGLVQ